jgi:hypothetical protein
VLFNFPTFRLPDGSGLFCDVRTSLSLSLHLPLSDKDDDVYLEMLQ